MKIHVGSGRVYLHGYKNTDLPGPTRHLAKDRPDLVEQWRTEDGDAYYGRQEVTPESVASGPAPSVETVCDVHCDVVERGLPCGLHEAEEVLLRQVVEHWSLQDFRRFLRHCDHGLRAGGVLRIDVPDMDATVDELQTTTDPVRQKLLRRHLLGHRGGYYDAHYVGYSRERLRDIVESEGFVFACEEPPLKDRWYPAFCLRFQKPTLQTVDPIPWQRLIPPGSIPEDWVCGEVGPGTRRFWPRANVVMDIEDRGAEDLPEGARFVRGDICDGYPEVEDQSLDFLLLSHILEHVKDPVQAVATINRITSRGVIECPHPAKEALLAFEEDDHRWWITSHDGVLYFLKPDEKFVEQWRNPEWSAAMHRILLTGPGLGSDGMVLRQHFLRGQRNEVLNTVHRWEGELRAEVVA